MSQNKYWQGFGEINDPENFQKKVQDEFREELPFEDLDGKGLLDAKAPLRDFLKYLGFSTAAAALAASCKTPVRKAVPYANKPENLVPGEAKYYATTYVSEGNVVPLVAKVRDGRPIYLSGNTAATTTSGASTARALASVLDLYDTNRITHPRHKVGDKFEEVPDFDQLDKLVTAALSGLGGKQVVLLTSSVVSPTSTNAINEFLAKYPGSAHVQYDAVSYSGMLQANEATFGIKAIPSYHFENASEVVVSIGADFLGTWLNSSEFQHGYTQHRKIDEKNIRMSKHYQFESFLSLTGANADERFLHRPSEEGAVALALYAALGGAVAAPAVTDAKLKAGIEKVAAHLKQHTGKSLVVSGSNDANVQTIVNAINAQIGAYGSTISWGAASKQRQGDDKQMADLIARMETGSVGALIMVDVNPAYSWPQADKFKAALKNVQLTVSFNPKEDETTSLVEYQVPGHHYLESWGDAELKAGQYAFVQPTIEPLFKTRAWQDSLLKWAGSATTYTNMHHAYWKAKLGGDAAYFDVLQNGVFAEAAETLSGGGFNSGSVATAAAAIAAAPKGGGKEVVVYENVATGGGAQAGNPWLLELPDPITKGTWGNVALISMKLAEELGIKLDNDYEYYPQKPIISVKANGKTIEIPILVMPGMQADTIAIPAGYGRAASLGKASEGIGVNVFPLTSFNGSTVQYYASGVVIEKTGKKEKVAQTQIHNSYEGRIEVVRETTLATFKQRPTEVKDWRDKLKHDYAPIAGDFRKEATLYGVHNMPGPKWGMNIDMNACYGCGACVIACHAENNVPVVGKSEVLRYHDMHWLRIDRYFVSDEKNPDDLKGVVFQPMMCQHCDNAPCENVCPVAATNHSEEGFNQMAYNRCIGTRYCANNCPYKVRRFNWADYTGADSFKNNQDQQLVGKLDPVIHQMNDELTRMVLNPDVTVRSRGVMEKCSFCIQRTQAGKLKAKKENRPLKDGDVKTACQEACASDAIIFGNIHDEESAITKVRKENPLRNYEVLEQLHVLPSVTYLSKIRNTDEVIAAKGAHAEEHHEGGATEHAPAAGGHH